MRAKAVDKNHVRFHCLGCECSHLVKISGGVGAWKFNGDFERPTFSPSILVRAIGPVIHTCTRGGSSF